MTRAQVLRRPRGLGYSALAFGSLGLAFLCVPLVGLIFAGTGLLAGLLALVRGHSRAFAYSGLAMSALAGVMNLTLPALWPERFVRDLSWYKRNPPVQPVP